MNAVSKKLSTYTAKPVQSSILWKLRTGRAYTAIELANEAGIPKKDIHRYLSRLKQADLVKEIERRNRGYYRLLDDTVKNTLHHHYLNQGITKSELTEKHQVTGITYCRTCYNHLAGEVGVLFTEALVKKGLIAIAEDSHFKLLPGAENYFREFGIDIESLRQKRGRFAKACIDFSERKYHLGGALSKALFDRMLEKEWIQQVGNSREVAITPAGEKAFRDSYTIEVQSRL